MRGLAFAGLAVLPVAVLVTLLAPLVGELVTRLALI